MKNKSLADTFNAHIKLTWVWLVLAITVGLTVLFYLSQKPQVVLYSRYIKTLSDYQLQESLTLRGMERVRSGYMADTVFVQAQVLVLREIAVSFTREMDEMRNMGVHAPSPNLVNRFEGEVLGKVAGMRRYATGRFQWLESLERVKADAAGIPPESLTRIRETLDSARAGYVVGFNVVESSREALPEPLQKSIRDLLLANEELALAWNHFSSEKAVLYSEDLIHFFQLENVKEMTLKSRIPMMFYFLSLVLLLSTFFFIFRSKQ